MPLFIIRKNLQIFTDFCKIKLSSTLFSYDRINLPGDKSVKIESKKFSDAPFDPVSNNRISNLSTDRDTKSCQVARLVFYKNKKMGRV